MKGSLSDTCRAVDGDDAAGSGRGSLVACSPGSFMPHDTESDCPSVCRNLQRRYVANHALNVFPVVSDMERLYHST